MIWRIFFFILVAIFGLTGPWPVFALVAALYALVYVGVELLFVSFCIDAFFNYNTNHWPMFTLGTLVFLLLIQLVRPHISIYKRDQ